MRRAIVIVIALAALLAAAYVLVRQVLPRESIRRMAEAELSRLLRQPVRIGALDVAVLPRPAAVGRAIVVGDGVAVAPALAIERVRLVPRPWSLFGDAIVIERLDIEGLDLRIRRDPSGRWEAPIGGAPVPGTVSAEGRTVQLNEVRLRDGVIRIFDAPAGAKRELQPSAAVHDIEASISGEAPRLRLSDVRARIGSAILTGEGRFDTAGLALDVTLGRVAEDDVPQLFALMGVAPPERRIAVGGDRPLALSIAVAPDGGLSATGEAAAQALTVGTIHATRVTARFRFGDGRLAVDPLSLSAFQGAFAGRLVVSTGETPASWRAAGTLENLDANALLEQTAAAGDKLLGRGDIVLDVTGRTGTRLPASLGGSMRLTIVDGVIRDFALLAALNRALRLTETSGSDTRFSRLSAPLAFGNGRARTDDLRLEATEVTIRSRGDITLSDMRLDLNAVAVFSPEKSKEMIRSVHELSGLRNAGGQVEVPFLISGTLGAPSVELDLGRILEITGRKELQRQLERNLGRIFRIPR